jgi:hypothetical protein
VAPVLQYDRGVRLTVVPPQDLTGAVRPVLTFNPRPPAYGQPSAPQMSIGFVVQRSLTPSPATAQIRILNLSKTSRDSIAGIVRSIATWRPSAAVVNVDGVLRPGGTEVTSTLAGMAAVRLEAGWGGALESLFVGTATRVHSRRQGPDWVTEIEATDGGFQIHKAVAYRPFPPKTPAGAVLAYLAETLGLGLAQTQGLTSLQAFSLVAGLHCQGDAWRGIQEMCAPLRLTCWIEDGQIWILGDGESLPGQALVVSPEKIPGAIRLYREPEPIDESGLRIECALASDLRCGHLVTLASSEQRGVYRVEAVEHRGESRGGPFGSAAVIRDPTPIGL